MRGERGLTTYIEEGEVVAGGGCDRSPHSATFLHRDLSVKKITDRSCRLLHEQQVACRLLPGRQAPIFEILKNNIYF